MRLIPLPHPSRCEEFNSLVEESLLVFISQPASLSHLGTFDLVRTHYMQPLRQDTFVFNRSLNFAILLLQPSADTLQSYMHPAPVSVLLLGSSLGYVISSLKPISITPYYLVAIIHLFIRPHLLHTPPSTTSHWDLSAFLSVHL